ncbi:DUF7507 domain-containing protein [Anaerosporobacter faecicola]|uniref:DUF7507 domain-containing protein n=1 Tax=Anaerosporobacter faecicola TaxID=2718714 RepID=UPI00143C89CC|nr:DUF11 domain-containing protein [Anaerosporobacter faecicola]
MSLITRYSDRIYGDIAFIGNTLGLSRRPITLLNPIRSPGTLGIVGSYITTDTTKTCGGFTNGTTCDYSLNKSTAELQLPANTEVIYAELIWSGNSSTDGGNIGNLMDNKIIFKGQNLAEIEIEPLEITKNNEVLVANSDVKVYTRSAIVTDYVKQSGNGTYYAGKIPAYLDLNDQTSHESGCVGWTLAVIYRYLSAGFDFKSITLYVGGLAVRQNQLPAQTVLQDFVTPDFDNIAADVLISAAEGDYNLTGENVYFGTEGNALINTPLSGPNNPVDNFFASQINGNDGNLVTTGTFGNVNHTRIGQTSQYIGVSGARQGWDITRVNASDHVDKNKTSATLRISTMGDSILVNGVAVVLDTSEPKIELMKQIHSTYVTVGSIVDYTVYVDNIGTETAENVSLTDTIPIGMNFVQGSVKVNGEEKPDATIVGGVPLGNITTTQNPIKVDFQLQVSTIDGIEEYRDYAIAEYHYTLQQKPYFAYSNEQVCYPRKPEIDLVKTASKHCIDLGGNDESRTVHYQLLLSNTGDVDITEVTVKDLLPGGMNLMEGTLQVTPAIPGELNIETGITIDILEKGAKYMFDYDVKAMQVSTGPCANDFINTASATGSYQLNELDTPKPIEASAEETVHCINTEFTKTANRTNVEIGDFVTYTLTVTNNSTVDFSKVVFFDTVPTNLEITASTPAGITKAMLLAGYDAGALTKGNSKTIQYTVQVKACSGLNNTAYATVYFKGSCYETEHVNTESKSWTLTCRNPEIVVEKSVDQCYVTTGDTIREYTIIVRNTGDVTIRDIVFNDNLANGAGTYVPNSTYYATNGVDNPGNPFNHNPSLNQVVVPDLDAGDMFTIRYSVDYGL